MIPVGWFLGRPLRSTFTYDRQSNRLYRDSNWINYFTARREEEADAPSKWVIEVEDASGENPNYYVNVLLDNGCKFLSPNGWVRGIPWPPMYHNGKMSRSFIMNTVFSAVANRMVTAFIKRKRSPQCDGENRIVKISRGDGDSMPTTVASS